MYDTSMTIHNTELAISHMCFKRHKMGIKLNILSILLYPSQFVYNVIFDNFAFMNFLIFCLYMEKLESLFFVGYLGALTIYLYRLSLPC